jgi:signal transduction histidine kinase
MAWRSAAVDALIAGAVLAFGQAEVWNTAGGGAAHLVGPPWANATAYGIASLLLVVRRRWPLAVLVGQCLVLTLEVVVHGASESLGALLPVLVGMYSVAAYAPRRQAMLGALAVVVWITVHTLRDPSLSGAGDLVGAASFAALLPLAWLLGDYAKTRRLYLVEVADRSRRVAEEQAERARRAADQDRAAIAREVHDVIAHGLTVMVRQAEAGDVRFDTEPARARASFPVIADTGRQALSEVRHLVALLRNDDAAPGPEIPSTLDALEALVAQVRAAGPEVRFEHDGIAGLPMRVQLTALRVVQEALTNTLRHGHARHAQVHLRREDGVLIVEVTDDGSADGLPAASHPGHGLIGMAERVAAHRGEFSAGPEPHGGFAVRVRLPLGSGDP